MRGGGIVELVGLAVTGAFTSYNRAMATAPSDCSIATAPSHRAPAKAPTEPGDPYAHLSPALVDLFAEGRRRFVQEFTPEEGLGPVYNQTACQTGPRGLGGIAGAPDALGHGSIRPGHHFGSHIQGLC